MKDPVAEPLGLPKEYGKVKKPLGWPAVRDRLEGALNYWLVTVRPDGRPHSVPSDGVWLDGAWYFSGGSDTVHMRNVAQNAGAVVNLGDGSWAVIVEGRARHFTPDEELARRIAAAGSKYGPLGYAPKPEEYLTGTWAVEADRVLAWTAFPNDATRFRFEG